jgi:hypothetical protein
VGFAYPLRSAPAAACDQQINPLLPFLANPANRN